MILASGNPWTSILNTVYGLALMDTVYVVLLKEKNRHDLIPNLHRHLYVCVYGDDNIVSLSEELAGLITPKEVSDKMKEYGHTYTDDKKGEIDTLKSIEEVTILKRNFLYDDDLGRCFAPLDVRVWKEMLNWDKETTESMKLAQLETNARTVQIELAQHPREVYEEVWTQIVYHLSCVGIDVANNADYDTCRVIAMNVVDNVEMPI